MSTDPEKWFASDPGLAKEEARLDERLLAKLSVEQRDELESMMHGASIGGFDVDLDALEVSQDSALFTSLTLAQRAELELIMRGESTGGPSVDLDRLEELLDRRVGA